MERLNFTRLSSTEDVNWNDLIRDLPGAHAFQTTQWGQVKSRIGWQSHFLVWQNPVGDVQAAAFVLQRQVPARGFGLNLSIMYAPRGPLLDWSDEVLAKQVLDDLKNFARKQGAIFIKVDPDLPLSYGIPGEEGTINNPVGETIQADLVKRGWHFSDEQIQFRNTVTIDLTTDEDDMLSRMKSKTRYNIRLAKRRGVEIRKGGVDDIELLYKMYAHTAVRDDFLIRHQGYYEAVWKTFFSAGLAKPLIAEVEGQPVGAVVIFQFGGRAWYIHGMSLDEHREKMFNYLLQWTGMLDARESGCYSYDMWGAPDNFNENDPLWSVYRFKDGFGGRVECTLGAWDYPVRPFFYRLYSQILPRILGWMRKRGKSATKRRLST